MTSQPARRRRRSAWPIAASRMRSSSLSGGRSCGGGVPGVGGARRCFPSSTATSEYLALTGQLTTNRWPWVAMAQTLCCMLRVASAAAELEAMDPSEVDAIFEDSITWYFADAPQELLARSRERILRRIEETEPTQRS